MTPCDPSVGHVGDSGHHLLDCPLYQYTVEELIAKYETPGHDRDPSPTADVAATSGASE